MYIIKIVIISDGKYGDRAARVIKKKFPETNLITIEERNPSEIIDDVTLEKEALSSIKDADLLIVYVRHADVVSEICAHQKPTILPIDFGEGFLRQVKAENSQIIMPISMCNALPNTGIKEIDEYFKQYGSPVYNIQLENSGKKIPFIKEANLSVESPCGASNISLDYIVGKEVTPDTLNSFAINIRQECREPVSVLLSHRDMSDSSAALHLLNLLNALEKEAPSIFLPGTPIGEYASKRREEFQTSTLKHLF